MIPERENNKYLEKFKNTKCPRCSSNKIVMKLNDINNYVCKKCGNKFSIDYDE